jgi:putative tryptophan/tyrosine transport system substrate-binding protein
LEEPTEFEFVVNMRTARTIGLNLPASLLARAKELLE